jgi:group II intron reverse transcriptase/maturase/CRISPR-associated endonuclease Cas1
MADTPLSAVSLLEDRRIDNVSFCAEVLVFRFTEATHTGAFHGPGLAGFVKGLLDAELPPDCWIAPVDGGIPWFEEGREYRLVVYAVDGSRKILDRLRDAAHARSGKGALDARAFGPRWRYVRSHDALHPEQAEIGAAAQLTTLDPETLTTEAAIWAAGDQAWLRFISPLQLLRPKDGRKRKGVDRFCQDAADVDGDLLLNRIRQGLDAFGRRLGLEQSLPVPEARIELSPLDLFWHGSAQIDAAGGEKPVYGLSGVMGLRVEGPDAAMVWHWLVIGQHLGIGQRRGFGYGRYRLEGPEGERIGLQPGRRASLLQSAMSLPNLDSAWDAIRNNKRRAAFERELDQVCFGLPPDADHRTELITVARQLNKDEYVFPPLHGLVIDKPKGGQRALAVPPLLDRVLQRAVAQMLTRVVEPMMYARSFGYRPGRNRMQARDYIQRLVREGYEWFFESDIDNFFDAVDHALIYNRLTSLLPDDPAVDRIMRWITAPVRYQGRLIQRGGLPQGSPLSPLLANLVLDDFDKDLVAAGFRPVRFADDFIVPCRTREQAERAGELVARSLAEKGLALNGDETRIARFANGLKFLGYRFVNDLAVEARRPCNDAPESDEHPHPSSWVAGLEQAEEAGESRQASANARPSIAAGATEEGEIARAGEARVGGTLVIVSEPGCVLYTRDGRLWRQRPEAEAISVAPWPEIGGLLLFGYQRITQPALIRAMTHGVPVYFTDGFGRLRGRAVSAPGHESIDAWPHHLDASRSENTARRVAIALVTARLAHQAQVLRRRGVRGKELDAFANAIDKAAAAESIESLRGIEGSATRAYFALIAQLVPDWCGFGGRNRRPPRDPLNALLSLGYTMLYAQTETLIRIAGLHPAYGFYHQRRGRHAALASDLMEPFRHLVESTAIAQLNRRQLSPDDFKLDGERGCRLKAKARRAFLAALGRRLSGCMTSADPISITGHEHMHRQVERLRSWLGDREQPFQATRLK